MAYDDSKTEKLVPLIILFSVLIAFAFVGVQVWFIMSQISDSASKKLEKKNVTFNKEGMKVGVKEIRDENYVDKTQSVLVKAWNLSTWPEYRSRFWNKEQSKEESRPQYVRAASSSSSHHPKAQ